MVPMEMQIRLNGVSQLSSRLPWGSKMVNTVSQHQRGFTLIEMSIVLVIIGLIIGGILKGQELIESSRQKNVISQVDRLKASTTSFVDRFRSLPGDFNRIEIMPNSGLLARGDDNGVVGDVNTTTTELAAGAIDASGEHVGYFNQLIAAGLASGGSLAGTTAAPQCFSGLCNTASPLPSSAFPQSGLTIHYGTHDGGGSTVIQPKRAHWLMLSRFKANAAAASGGTTDGVVSPERAFQIDYKYDDGVSGGGNIRTLTGLVPNCGQAGTDYVATDSTVGCVLFFAVE